MCIRDSYYYGVLLAVLLLACNDLIGFLRRTSRIHFDKGACLQDGRFCVGRKHGDRARLNGFGIQREFRRAEYPAEVRDNERVMYVVFVNNKAREL